MNRWCCWHVYQHDRQDELLVEAVAPLLRNLRSRELVDQAFVLRYWERGPHVRLRVRPTSEQARAVIEDEIPRVLESWCRDHRSHRPMTAEAYAVLLERLGNGEVNHSLVEDGTVLSEPYLPEHERYGTGRALAACERHFSESTDLALDLLTSNLPVPARESLCVLLLFDVLATLPDSVRRAWARQVVRFGGGPGRLPAIDLGRLQGAVASPPEPVRRFAASLDVLRNVLRLAGAEYTPPEVGFGGIRFSGTGSNSAGNNGAGNHDAAATLDICVHLFCNRIGVTMPTELLLRRAVAAALDQELEATA
jgi:Lantibiotic biosynthesis dehydratase C-term